MVTGQYDSDLKSINNGIVNRMRLLNNMIPLVRPQANRPSLE